jgi:hypothetical protein
MKDAHLATCLGCSRKYCIAEMILGNHLGTAEGKKYNLAQILAAVAPGLGLMFNYNKLPNWAKKPLPEKEYNAKTF